MQQKTSGLSKGVYGNDFNIAMSLAMLRKTVPLFECNALSAVIKSAMVRYSVPVFWCLCELVLYNGAIRFAKKYRPIMSGRSRRKISRDNGKQRFI